MNHHHHRVIISNQNQHNNKEFKPIAAVSHYQCSPIYTYIFSYKTHTITYKGIVCITEGVFRSFQLWNRNWIEISEYYSDVSYTTLHLQSQYTIRRSLPTPILLSVLRSFHSTTTSFPHSILLPSRSRALCHHPRPEMAPEMENRRAMAPEKQAQEESDGEVMERCGEIAARERGEKWSREVQGRERENQRRRERSGGRGERWEERVRGCGERCVQPLFKRDLRERERVCVRVFWKRRG